MAYSQPDGSYSFATNGGMLQH
ncbi:uncharacterized protein FFFS_16049 [Fusarium fujikuroi]|nr:uncharacterized protein FFFS_16049 [Fusarium fujikuroi]